MDAPHVALYVFIFLMAVYGAVTWRMGVLEERRENERKAQAEKDRGGYCRVVGERGRVG